MHGTRSKPVAEMALVVLDRDRSVGRSVCPLVPYGSIEIDHARVNKLGKERGMQCNAMQQRRRQTRQASYVDHASVLGRQAGGRRHIIHHA
jgi:hypothetical protein